jgi:hypothetical protein
MPAYCGLELAALKMARLALSTQMSIARRTSASVACWAGFAQPAAELGADEGGGHVAGHLAGVVAAHAVGQHGQRAPSSTPPNLRCCCARGRCRQLQRTRSVMGSRRRGGAGVGKATIVHRKRRARHGPQRAASRAGHCGGAGRCRVRACSSAAGQLVATRPASAWRCRRALVQQLAPPGGQVGDSSGRRLRRSGAGSGGHARSSSPSDAFVRQAAAQQLEQQHAQRIEVAARIGRPPASCSGAM